MDGTQLCYNCKKYFCFCITSINIHKSFKSLNLYCYEKMEDSPVTDKRKRCGDHDGPPNKKRKFDI